MLANIILIVIGIMISWMWWKEMRSDIEIHYLRERIVQLEKANDNRIERERG